MGKYNTYYKEPDINQRDKNQLHPVWRGIGFLMIVLIPALAYLATLVIIQQNQVSGWFLYPADIIARGKDPFLYIKIGGTVALSMILYAVLMLVTFFVNRLFAPPYLGPLDAPPVRRPKSHRR